MADHELTPEDGFRRLNELFNSEDASVPNRGCRRYVLEFDNGKPVFRRTNSDPAHPRTEIEVAVDQMIDEELGNDIVPQKLAKRFPGSLRTPRS